MEISSTMCLRHFLGRKETALGFLNILIKHSTSIKLFIYKYHFLSSQAYTSKNIVADQKQKKINLFV